MPKRVHLRPKGLRFVAFILTGTDKVMELPEKFDTFLESVLGGDGSCHPSILVYGPIIAGSCQLILVLGQKHYALRLNSAVNITVRA